MNAKSSSPTLARLSFWAPPGRMAEFEAVYEQKIAPLLKKHGLVESAERRRKTVEGVFSRLFEMETPAAVVFNRGREGVRRDAAL